MFYEKLAEAREEKKRLSTKQKLGLGLGAAGLLTAGILGRKRLGKMFRRNAPDMPTSTKGVVGDGIVDTPEELFDLDLYHYGRVANRPHDVMSGTQDITDELKKVRRFETYHDAGPVYGDSVGGRGAQYGLSSSHQLTRLTPAGSTRHDDVLDELGFQTISAADHAAMQSTQAYNPRANISPYRIRNLTREQAESLIAEAEKGQKSRHQGVNMISNLLEDNPHVRVEAGPIRPFDGRNPQPYDNLKDRLKQQKG